MKLKLLNALTLVKKYAIITATVYSVWVLTHMALSFAQKGGLEAYRNWRDQDRLRYAAEAVEYDRAERGCPKDKQQPDHITLKPGSLE